MKDALHSDASPTAKEPFDFFYLFFLVALCLGAFQLIWFLSVGIERGFNVDSVWLHYITQQALGGKRLYIDLIETNPPLALLFHLPAALAGKILSLSAGTEKILYLLTVTSTCVFSLWVSYRVIERSALEPPYRHSLAACMLIALGYLSHHIGFFGEREHMIVVLILPWLLSSWLAPVRLKRWEIMAVGLMAALGFAIKPYFYPLWIATECLRKKLAVKQYFTDPLNQIIAAFAFLYGFVILVFFPDYLTSVLPLLLEAYGAFRHDDGTIYLGMRILWWPFLFLLPVFLSVPRIFLFQSIRLWLAALVTSIAAVFLQFKGWNYTYYPPVALTMTGLPLLFRAVRRTQTSTPRRGFSCLCIILCGLSLFLVMNIYRTFFASETGNHPNPMTQAYEELNRFMAAEKVEWKTPPSLFAFSIGLETGPLLMYDHHMRWGGPYGHLWMVPAFAAQGKLEELAEELAADLELSSPNYLIFDDSADTPLYLPPGIHYHQIWSTLHQAPGMVSLMEKYQLYHTIDTCVPYDKARCRYLIYKRKSDL